jgi:phospholysine phosphohistidine inorganic pyrophosphate phosphatase
MKELLTKNFWRDVKRTFDEAREGSPNPPTKPDVTAPAGAAATVQATRVETRGVLFDMDGVVYDANRPIAGAAETVRWVQSESVPHLFVTNTTSRSRADLVAKLAGFGIHAVETEILTPIAAAVEWLRADDKGGVAVFVRPAARNEFAGLPLLAEDAERGAAYVVIGDLGDLWDYRTLNRAFRLLHNNPGAKLIALGMTRYWMAADGIALDVAPFVVALAHASGRKPLVFGKPSGAFFRAAADRLHMPPGQILMVGDDIEADVGGAQAAGLKAALVKTGKFRAADLDHAIRPEIVLDSVADLPQWWSSERHLRDQQRP